MARFESVQIQWHDSPEEKIWALVSIDEEWNGLEDEEDDRIFFYFANEQEFEEAKQPNNQYEFRILEED